MPNEPFSPAANPRAKLALVSFDSLGDGLIYLMMAENLRQNGFDITCYGQIAYQMRHWLPQLNIEPYPEPLQFEATFDAYDLAIVSPPRFVRNKMDAPYTEKLAQKYILICQKTPESWCFDHTERIKTTRNTQIFEQLKGLLNSSGSIRFKAFTDENVVEMCVQYLREKMQLTKVSKTLALTPPVGLQHRRFLKRIVVCPDSAGPEQKNWSPTSFIKLCYALQARGYAPEIVVAPNHHAEWLAMPGNSFHTPCFPDIGQLCAYLYESAVVIANDSGNGHLASFLNIPTITLYRKRNPRFHWRPDWGRSLVVCPRFTLPWFGGALWKPFLRRSQILAALEKLI